MLEFVLERWKNGLPVTGDIIREKAYEVARARNIQGHVFKASRGWVDRFMRRIGLSLRRHTAICQKLPTDFEEKLVSELPATCHYASEEGQFLDGTNRQRGRDANLVRHAA